MAKPGSGGSGGSSGGGTVKGSNASESFKVASTQALGSTIYDGGGGSDTLDMSALTTGVTVRLPTSSAQSKSFVYPDRPYTGFYTEALYPTDGRISGTIRNFENLIGGSGNDNLGVQQGGFVDGGAGNDYLFGRTIIGGLGSDNLNSLSDGSVATMIGGTYVGGVAYGDGTRDTFEVDGSAVILDFELGIDTLILPASSGGAAALQTATWVDTVYNGKASASLTFNGQTVTLAGITATQAQSIEIGLFMSGTGTIVSGPGDDIIWPDTSTADRLVFSSGSGNDMISHFNLSQDTLAFANPSTVVWSVNGQTALHGSYDGGASS